MRGHFKINIRGTLVESFLVASISFGLRNDRNFFCNIQRFMCFLFVR